MSTCRYFLFKKELSISLLNSKKWFFLYIQIKSLILNCECKIYHHFDLLTRNLLIIHNVLIYVIILDKKLCVMVACFFSVFDILHSSFWLSISYFSFSFLTFHLFFYIPAALSFHRYFKGSGSDEYSQVMHWARQNRGSLETLKSPLLFEHWS